MRDEAHVRCSACGVINRLPADKVAEHPRCGKCKALLEIPRSPVEVTEATFEKHILSWPGVVLVMFWSPV
jgi:thioredoxin 2